VDKEESPAESNESDCEEAPADQEEALCERRKVREELQYHKVKGGTSRPLLKPMYTFIF